MSTTKTRIGKGTSIGYAADATSAPGSFTKFLEVKKVDPPEEGVASVKATHYESPNGAHEFLPGWIDAGEVSMDCNYIDTDLVVLEGMLGLMKWFQIKYPLVGAEATAASHVFRGFITKLGGEIPNEEGIMTKVTFKISGLPVFAAAA